MQALSADGVIHEFPDGTDMSVVDRVMKSYVADGPQPAAPDPSQHWAAPAGGEFGDLRQFNAAKGPEVIPQPVTAFAQSAWGRLSGTDRPPADTGDAVDTVDTRDTIAPGLRSALAPAANTTYGSILPFARDQGTGDVRLALPSSLRDLATGGLDLLEGPTTGTVTPAATSLLANAAIGGGLNPSPARGTGAAIRDTAELGAPAADLYRPRITATEVQARDGVGIMEAWNRAHAENNAAAIDKIGQATDIDGAIAAFGKAAEAPGAAAGNAAGTISPSVNVPAGTEAAPAGEVLGAGDLWRTDPEQLQAMLGEKGLSDRQKTVQALGSEAAAVEFYRLDRKQNSSDPQRADEGSREFQAKFGNLTPDQERLIYGVGETDAQADDIKQVLDAHSRISNDPTDAGYEAALAIRKVPAAEIMAVPEGNASPMAQAAYVRLKNAYGDMLDAGIAPDRVLSNIADALVKRGGWSPGDAAEVVGDFGEEMRRAAGTKATPVARPQIAGPTSTAPITTAQVQRRDGVGAIEAGRRADAENAANAPVPQSVGAAASRDTTLGTSFGRSAREITGAQADKELADLMRTPQPGDSRDIIPGATQTRAEIELSPSTSREAKGLRQEFREGFNEHEKANNELYHNWVDDVTPTKEQIGTMKDVREAQWKADEATVFGPSPNGEPVTTAPIVQHLQEVLADPVEKHNSYLLKAFQPLLDKLTDDDGAPIQLGAKELYGIRQEMGRKVKDMATDTDLAHLRGQFGDLMKVTDDAIMAGAPDYRAMMDRYRDASIPINAGERLQEGALKITNGSDRTITFGKFDAFMKGLWMERNGPNPYAKAKAIDQATWDHLMQLHERLARSASDQELARTRGSDTTQLMMEMMRKGAIGTAHAIVGKLTGGLGNIAIPIITKQIDESRALRRVGQHLNPDLSRYPTPGP